MKILSRPPVKQPCEDIVLNALRPLYTMSASSFGGHKGSASNYIPLSLPQFSLIIGAIFHTLMSAKVLTDYKISAPVETKDSTYEKEEWVLIVRFTDDPARASGYVVDLRFTFTRAS